MITDSLRLLQTERSAEGYKYSISARIFYKKQKSIYPLSPTNFLYYVKKKKTVFLRSGFGVFSKLIIHLRAMNLRLSRGLTHRPELGAGVLPGEFLPLEEDVFF